MFLSTSENIPGKEYEILNLVKGLTVYSKNIGKDLMSIFKGAVGGEMKAYTDMVTESISIATDRMIEEAEKLNTDAITCTRYESCSLMDGVIEFTVYGTAVKFV